MTHFRAIAVAIGLLAAAPAWAQEAPRFCPNRPSLGASGCTTDPGRVQFELSGVDWQLDRQDGSREDRVLAADALARIGVGPATEVQVGWSAFGHVRERDAAGAIDRTSSVGDVRLAVRQNLANPDGSGLSYAVEPFVTLPVGREPVSNGDWGAGVVLPVTYDLSDRWNLAFTGEVDAAVDEDGDGRHLAYGGIIGLGYQLSDQLTAVAELSVSRDRDPVEHETVTLAAGSLAWQPRSGLQLDVLAAAGLNHASPDIRLVLGGAVLF